MSKRLDEIKARSLDQLKRLKEMAGPELVVLSYGIGQDSTAIINKLVYDKSFFEKYVGKGKLIVITADTGNEHPETYRYLKKIIPWMKKNNIDFYFLTPDQGFHSDSWQDLKSFYRRTTTIGSKAFPKTCTDNLKIKVIYNFLEEFVGREYGYDYGRKKAIKAYAQDHGRINVIIGIAGGEEKRAVGNDQGPLWMQSSINKLYPLIDLGWDRQACQDYIVKAGQEIPLPSNCMICPFMSDVELLWLWRFYPDEFREWVKIEKAKLDKHKDKGDKNLTVWGTHDTLEDILKKAKEKYKNWSDKKLQKYKMTHGHCNMSRY